MSEAKRRYEEARQSRPVDCNKLDSIVDRRPRGPFTQQHNSQPILPLAYTDYAMLAQRKRRAKHGWLATLSAGLTRSVALRPLSFRAACWRLCALCSASVERACWLRGSVSSFFGRRSVAAAGVE